jgi:transposase
MSANILNLPSYIVTNIEETEHDYHINAETKSAPQKCPHCYGDNLVGFGRNEQLVRDLPIHGKRIGIYVDTRRYQCRACNKTFYERLPNVDGKRMMTSRLVAWLGKQSVKRLFSHLAEEIGISEMTVKNVFNDYINELERTVRFETPQWMGIDEIHIIKKPRCVVSNIKNNTIVNILRDRNKKTVAEYLFRLKGRDLVKCVAIDMWEPYKDAVRDVMPQARIVVDKFHVVRMANECLEAVRKEIRSSLTDKQRRGLMHDRFILLKREANLEGLDRITLESWTKNYPTLGAAYRAKEDFFAVYDAMTVTEAQTLYWAWEDRLAPEIKTAFYPLTRAVNNWMPEIMTYFDHPVTNAYTESLNNLTRVMNRLGRGYSFEALRAKILFTEGVSKIKKPKFRRPEPTPSRSGAYECFTFSRSIATPSTQTEEREINYGADISTLVRMIEEGRL